MADISDLPDFGDPALLDHSTQGWKALVVIVLCTTLVTICVGLRIYTRKVIINELWIDDYLTIVSNIILIGQSIQEGIQVRDGVGTHLWDLLAQPGALVEYEKQTWVGLLIYNITGVFVKSMFFFQYYRIVRNVPRLKMIYSIIMTLIVLWCVSQILVTAFTCIPIDGLWDPSIKAVCNPIGADPQFYMASIGNIVTDIIILLLPIPVVWKLKLRRPQKVVLFVIFGLGFFTCLISSFRLIFLKKPADFTWDAISVLCWSHSEISSGMICATIPTLKPLLGKFIPALGTSRQTTKGYQKYDHGSRGKDFASPKSVELSTKDTGIYGLTDLEVGLDRPHPVRIDTQTERLSRHSPKASLPVSVHSLSSPTSDTSAEDVTSETIITRARPNGRQPSQEIRVQKEWILSSHRS